MAASELLEIRPQPGPQEAFLSSDADIAIYGGQAGSGKTFALLLSLMMGVHRHGYSAVVFRRTSPELFGGGSIWEESQELYRAIGGTPRQSPNLEWRWPETRALIEFRHLQHESDVYGHQGKQYAQIAFDELTHFEESQFWYLLGRARSMSGVNPFIRATCNPDPDSFVRQLLDWWIDGETGYPIQSRSGVKRWFVRTVDGALDWGDSAAEVSARNADVSMRPMSLTFVPAKLDDNQLLLARDPEYRSRLEALAPTQRARLLHGNWNARATAGSLFRRPWFHVVDEAPHTIVREVRAWDKAASEVTETRRDPDWTRGALVGITERDELVISDVQSLRGTPGAVLHLIETMAEQDGKGVIVGLAQDPGQAGVVDIETTRARLLGHRVVVQRAALGKVEYAEAWSPIAEAGRVYLLRAAWNDAFLREAEGFPDGKHDDMIDAVSLAVQILGTKASSGSVVHKPSAALLAKRTDPLGVRGGNWRMGGRGKLWR